MKNYRECSELIVFVDSDSDNWRRDGRALSPRGGFARRGRGGMRGRGGIRGRGRGRSDVEHLTGNVACTRNCKIS